MSKKMNISLGLRDEAPSDISSQLKKVDEIIKNIVTEEQISPAYLISVVDYPIIVKYGESKIRITGRSIEKVQDHSKLGTLPSGIVLKK